MLVCIWLLSSFFDHYIISDEVIGFRLFRATGLAFIYLKLSIFKVQVQDGSDGKHLGEHEAQVWELAQDV